MAINMHGYDSKEEAESAAIAEGFELEEVEIRAEGEKWHVLWSVELLNTLHRSE